MRARRLRLGLGGRNAIVMLMTIDNGKTSSDIGPIRPNANWIPFPSENAVDIGIMGFDP